MKVKNDFVRARRWYTMLTVILAVAFVAYYAATGTAVPRWDEPFQKDAWAMQHIVRGDFARFWTVLMAPLAFVGGVMLLRRSNIGTGYTEGALMGAGFISTMAGITMLPWGVAAGLWLWLGAVLIGAVAMLGIATFRFTFNKATWRRLGDWLGGKDVEEAQKNGDQPTAVISSCGETAIAGENAW